MSFLTKLKEKSAELAENTIKIVKVDAELHKARLDICMTCEHLIKDINKCEICGCFMTLKTWIPGAECPKQKWSKVIK